MATKKTSKKKAAKATHRYTGKVAIRILYSAGETKLVGPGCECSPADSYLESRGPDQASLFEELK